MINRLAVADDEYYDWGPVSHGIWAHCGFGGTPLEIHYPIPIVRLYNKIGPRIKINK
jgi:hypothetical protein